MHYPVVFLQVICEDEVVIQVDDDMPLVDEVPEDVVHHPLEGRWGVAESKEHDRGLIQTLIGPEGCLPLVVLLDANVVVPPLYVQLGEVLCIAMLVYQLLDERQWVPVLDGVLIELLAVLDGSEGAAALEDEEEW